MGMFDDEEFSPRTRRNNKTDAADGVEVNTPSVKTDFKGSAYRVFFWIFTVTFVMVVSTLLFSYMYVLLNNKDMPTTDAFVTVLKVIANILLGLVGGE